jgi:fused signal recognition particle receptor
MQLPTPGRLERIGHVRLRVHPRRVRQPAVRRQQLCRVLPVIALEWRIQEHHVERACRRLGKRGQRIDAPDRAARLVQARQIGFERPRLCRIPLEEQYRGSAPRQGFDPERAGAREGVQDAGADDHGSQPVEQGLPKALRGGPEAGRSGDAQSRAAQAAADHAHPTRRRPSGAALLAHGQPGQRTYGGRCAADASIFIPVIFRDTRSMQKLWKKLRGRADGATETPAPAPFGASPALARSRSTDASPLTIEAPPEHLPDDYTTQRDAPLPNRAMSVDDLDPPPAAAPVRRGWRERLADSGFARGLTSLFARNPVLSEDLLDELEVTLLTADVGVDATRELIDDLRRRMRKREFADAAALREALRGALIALLEPVSQPLDVAGRRPFVMLVVGVNGVGKTTTIGKLARRFQGEHRGVLLAAGDTFRAAAVAQLQEWGERIGAAVVAREQGADSAGVVFDALQTAIARGVDILIADTAGRLHTQSGLMNELAKVRRVLGKLDPAAPHEVLMVIDGTTGQNAISQVHQFAEAVGVTGLAVTKLDGTAKGGVLFALAREFSLPVRYVGLGERADDLRVFDARAFVDSLLPPRE